MLKRISIQLVCAIVLLGIFYQPAWFDGGKSVIPHSGTQKLYKSQSTTAFFFDENEEDTKDADDDVEALLTAFFSENTFTLIHFFTRGNDQIRALCNQHFSFQERPLWLVHRVLIR